MTKALNDHPLITIERGEVDGLPPEDWSSVIVATGPLTSPALRPPSSTDRRGRLGLLRRHCPDRLQGQHRFRHLLVPVALRQGRAGGTGADYINCPMDRDQYYAFIDALLAGDKTEFKDWEDTPYFDGCLPIEVMAERGRRDPAPRPDEAGRPDQSAQPDSQGLCHRSAAPGQCARHAVQHGRFPDQAEIWRTEPTSSA